MTFQKALTKLSRIEQQIRQIQKDLKPLPDGKLILPGRISHEIDAFPITPAVMISDSGKADSTWRLVKIQEDGILPDDSKLIHPELSLAVCNGKIYVFCKLLSYCAPTLNKLHCNYVIYNCSSN